MLFGASIFCTMFPCLTRFAHTFFHTSTSCSRAILSFDCRRQPEWYRDLCLLPRRARTVVTSLDNCGNFPGPGKLPQLVFPVFPHRDMERQILCAKCLQPEPSSRRTTSRVWQPPMTSSDLLAATNPNTIEDIARKVNYAVGATKIFMQLVTHIDPLAWVLRYHCNVASNTLFPSADRLWSLYDHQRPHLRTTTLQWCLAGVLHWISKTPFVSVVNDSTQRFAYM